MIKLVCTGYCDIFFVILMEPITLDGSVDNLCLHKLEFYFFVYNLTFFIPVFILNQVF